MTTPRTTPLLTPDGRAFEGFPSSGLATAVPNIFFARLLPEIVTPEELVLTVYFFYAQQQAPGPRRTPRFLTRRELAADATLLRSLANLAGGTDHEALGRALLETWVLPFEIASVLLTAALVGAIMLTRSAEEEAEDALA